MPRRTMVLRETPALANRKSVKRPVGAIWTNEGLPPRPALRYAGALLKRGTAMSDTLHDDPPTMFEKLREMQGDVFQQVFGQQMFGQFLPGAPATLHARRGATSSIWAWATPICPRRST